MSQNAKTIDLFFIKESSYDNGRKKVIGQFDAELEFLT